MNNLKSIVFFLLAIAALGVAQVMLRGGGRDKSVRPSVRPSLIVSDEGVSRIALERKGERSVVLSRTEGWKIESPYAGRADGRAVARLLDALAFSPISDVIADSDLLKLGRTRADFSLADPLFRVTLFHGTESEGISFGAPTPAADGVYAAVDGTDAIFVVPSDILTEVDRPADSFRRRAVFDADQGTVTSFGIKRGIGSLLSFVRTGEGWTTDGKRASDKKVRAFLSDLTTASAVDFVWPVGLSNETAQASASLLAGYGLDPESAVTVILKDAGGADQQVSFGKEADDKLVYAYVQNGSAVVTLPAGLREAALQDQLMFADSRVFPVDESAVAFLSLTEGDTVCALSRDADGVWSLDSPIVAAANASSVKEVLARVLSLSPSDLAGTGLSVSISTNSEPVVVTRESVLGRRTFESLRSLEMVRIDPPLVRRVSRAFAAKDAGSTSVVCGRDRKTWNVESDDGGKNADGAGVAALLAALNPLRAVRVEKLKVSASDLDDYGLDRPFMTLAVDQNRADAVRRNILVGGETKGGRFATIGSADAIFVLSDATLKKLSVPLVR